MFSQWQILVVSLRALRFLKKTPGSSGTG